jgi:hypothetical protein
MGEARHVDLLATLWQQLFVLKPTHEIMQEVWLELSPTALIKSAGSIVFQAEHLTIKRNENGFELDCAESQLQLKVDLGQAKLYLHEGFWQQSVYNQREFFLLALLMLLRPKGLYGLHACGLKKDGSGLLLVGSSGSGKTTTMLNLMKSGWQFLSDDAVLLHETLQDVEALAFRKGFSVMPDVAHDLGSLATGFEFDDPEGKKVVEFAADFGGGHCESCKPKFVLFPKLSTGVTRLEAMNPVEALLKLSQQSGGIMPDPNLSQKQLCMLKTLLQQVQCFKLHLVNDALANPDLVSNLIQEVSLVQHV